MTLPVDVAASVHQLAKQLHAVLHDEMVKHTHPSPEVSVLWQAAKLLNTAVGGLDYAGDSTPEADRHLRGLTPLFWTHVAPYGEVKLDMRSRLMLGRGPQRL